MPGILPRSALSGTNGRYQESVRHLTGIASPHVPTVRHRPCCSSPQQPYGVPATTGPRSTYAPLFKLRSTHQEVSPAAVAGRAKTEAAASLQPSTQQWHQLVLDSISDPGNLVRLVLKAKISVSSDGVLAHVSYKGPSSSNTSSPAQAAEPGTMPYKQLTIRPVMLRGRLHLQMSLLNSRQDTTKNLTHDQAAEQLQQILQLPWQSASLQTTSQTTNIQISKRGKVLIQTSKNSTAPAAAAAAAADTKATGRTVAAAVGKVQQRSGLGPIGQHMISSSISSSAAPGPISLQHDRVKAVPINGSVSDLFLQKIGLQTADGRIKANMQAKFTQINEFVKLLIHTGQLEHLGQQQLAAAAPSSSSTAEPDKQHSSSSSNTGPDQQQQQQQQHSSSSSVHILDCGCGSSHLTFGTYHYLSNIRGLPIQLTGIDTNKALMDRSNQYCEDIGISDYARFRTAAIRNYQPQQLPDIVLALHACDTATDESLALGIKFQARIVMSVPCCHKDLHRQQQRQHGAKRQRGSSSGSSSSVDLFDPLLSHGILRQRMLDLLTDTFRAHLLRLMGYRTDVVEFVSGEHTPRNLLIRAVKQQGQLSAVEQSRLAEQYIQLKEYWGVTPHLEKLLREDGLLSEQLQLQ